MSKKQEELQRKNTHLKLIPGSPFGRKENFRKQSSLGRGQHNFGSENFLEEDEEDEEDEDENEEEFYQPESVGQYAADRHLFFGSKETGSQEISKFSLSLILLMISQNFFWLLLVLGLITPDRFLARHRKLSGVTVLPEAITSFTAASKPATAVDQPAQLKSEDKRRLVGQNQYGSLSLAPSFSLDQRRVYGNDSPFLGTTQYPSPFQRATTPGSARRVPPPWSFDRPKEKSFFDD